MITTFKLFENLNKIQIINYALKNSTHNVKKCIDNGEINDVDDNNETVLFYATIIDHISIDIFNLLVSHPTLNVNIQNNTMFQTPLHLTDDIKKIIAICNYNVDWTLKDVEGDTFFEKLTPKNQKTLINKFPTEYEKYTIWKKTNEYNI